VNDIDRLRDQLVIARTTIANLHEEIERLRERLDAGLNVRDKEIERLRAHIAKLEAWQQKGQKLFDNYAVGLGAMFGLGKWWGERPWKSNT
jgi:uncharacterized small protein (DUF1192 family)